MLEPLGLASLLHFWCAQHRCDPLRRRNCAVGGCKSKHVSVCEVCAKFGPPQSADAQETSVTLSVNLKCPFHNSNKRCQDSWKPGEYEKMFL